MLAFWYSCSNNWGKIKLEGGSSPLMKDVKTVKFTRFLRAERSFLLRKQCKWRLIWKQQLIKQSISRVLCVLKEKFNYEFDAVKEEVEGQKHSNGKPGLVEDPMYMKALFYALPLDYITPAKLQSKLEGEANLPTVRKLIDKMAQEGFLETKSNQKLGRRVIHSKFSNKKLMEVKKALDVDVMGKTIRAYRHVASFTLLDLILLVAETNPMQAIRMDPLEVIRQSLRETKSQLHLEKVFLQGETFPTTMKMTRLLYVAGRLKESVSGKQARCPDSWL